MAGRALPPPSLDVMAPHNSGWFAGGAQATRRSFLASLSALALAPRVAAQSAGPHIAARSINHVALAVTDVQRSLAFYQDLFGMWNYAADGQPPRLRIGQGPSFLGFGSGDPDATGGLGHLCLGVDDFDPDEILTTLAAHGVAAGDAPGAAPLTASVTRRGDSAGVFFTDPDGILVQLQDVSYCGGTGPLGAQCPPLPRERMIRPSSAPVRLHTINHVVLAVPDPARTGRFWRELFPAFFGIGASRGGGAASGARPRRRTPPPFMGFVQGDSPTPRLDHLCFGMENFEPDGLMRRLLDFGLTEQVGGSRYGLSGPPLHVRAFARPASPDSTNTQVAVEIYLTDPDRIVLQLNDVTYCSGYGRLGNDCS